MAEAARRINQAGGSDLVRRMLARPIRMESYRPAPPVVTPMAADAPDFDESVDETDDIARLELELTLTKAILDAERQEAAALRALIEQGGPLDAVGDDAKAVRDRWAHLVDTLLRPVR